MMIFQNISFQSKKNKKKRLSADHSSFIVCDTPIGKAVHTFCNIVNIQVRVEREGIGIPGFPPLRHQAKRLP